MRPDGELIYWSTNLGNALHHYAEAGFTCCSLSRDGQLVLAGDKAGFMHVFLRRGLQNAPLNGGKSDSNRCPVRSETTIKKASHPKMSKHFHYRISGTAHRS